jgi:hypothetical protein
MHTHPMDESEGDFRESWKPTRAENPGFCRRKCGSNDVYYRIWDSSDGGYVDFQYECRGCGREWWVEGADA